MGIDRISLVHACRARRGLDRLWGFTPGHRPLAGHRHSVRAAGNGQPLAPGVWWASRECGGIPPRSRAWRESLARGPYPIRSESRPRCLAQVAAAAARWRRRSASRSWGIRSRASAARARLRRDGGTDPFGIPSGSQFLRANRRLGPRRLRRCSCSTHSSMRRHGGDLPPPRPIDFARSGFSTSTRPWPSPREASSGRGSDCLDWGASARASLLPGSDLGPGSTSTSRALRMLNANDANFVFSGTGESAPRRAFVASASRCTPRSLAMECPTAGCPDLLLAGEPHAIEPPRGGHRAHQRRRPRAVLQRPADRARGHAFRRAHRPDRSRHGSPGPDRGTTRTGSASGSRSGHGRVSPTTGEHPAGQRAGRPRDATGLVGVDRSRAHVGGPARRALSRDDRPDGPRVRLCRGPQAPGWPPLALRPRRIGLRSPAAPGSAGESAS